MAENDFGANISVGIGLRILARFRLQGCIKSIGLSMERFPIHPLFSSIQIKALSEFTMCIVWGKGSIDGIQTAESLAGDAKAIARWNMERI